MWLNQYFVMYACHTFFRCSSVVSHVLSAVSKAEGNVGLKMGSIYWCFTNSAAGLCIGSALYSGCINLFPTSTYRGTSAQDGSMMT